MIIKLLPIICISVKAPSEIPLLRVLIKFDTVSS